MKIGITIGDPSGIGPEIIQKVFQNLPSEFQHVQWKIYGIPIENLNGDVADIQHIANDLPWKNILPGNPDKVAAQIQKRAFDAAIQDALDGKIDAIVTAPWTKYIFELLGEKPTGHTEVLRDATGEKPVMLLAGERLRVALVTTHIPLQDVAKNISKKKIHDVVEIVNNALIKDFGIAEPHIAILGLNPHAGENGAMGNEEIEIIAPVIKTLQNEGLHVSGPFSADTYFIRYLHEFGQRHDAVICMYHDQGLIPLKAIHFGESANITLGLPLIRTSVDHGSAHDIAGQNIADPGSLVYAMQTAIQIVNHRTQGNRHD